jgi:hypothetical protein
MSDLNDLNKPTTTDTEPNVLDTLRAHILRAATWSGWSSTANKVAGLMSAVTAVVSGGRSMRLYRRNDANSADEEVVLLPGVSIGGNAATASDVQAGSKLDTSLAAKAPLNSPVFVGVPTTPTAAPGTNTTQVANTAFVRTEVANVVGSTPAALDTLNELATALGNDPNFAATITGALGNKAPLNGVGATGTWTINISGQAGSSVLNVSLDGDRNPSTIKPSTTSHAVRYDFVNGSAAGVASRYAGLMTYAPWDGKTASTGDASYQLAFGGSAADSGGVPTLNIRKGIDATWNAWYTLLHSGNFNAYAPGLTGGGASGTWNINITGTATVTTSQVLSATTGASAGGVGSYVLASIPNSWGLLPNSNGTVDGASLVAASVVIGYATTDFPNIRLAGTWRHMGNRSESLHGYGYMGNEVGLFLRIL